MQYAEMEENGGEKDPQREARRSRSASLSKTETLLLIWDELAHWQRDNQFLYTGYRKATGSAKDALLSLFSWHNETINVWTHLLPAVLTPFAFWLIDRRLRAQYPGYSTADYAALCLWVSCFVGCMGISSVYHLFNSHSEPIAKWSNKLDYVGITLLIWGSFIPSLYYGFSEHQYLRNTYFTMISVLAFACVIISIFPKFATPDFRSLRAAIFSAMGLSGIIPVIHALTFMTIRELDDRMSLYHMLAQGVLYLAGAVLYGSRVPERWYPKRFDCLGASHQIFHVLVVMAAIVHFRGIILALEGAQTRDLFEAGSTWVKDVKDTLLGKDEL